jgi:endogenous inhibitor of DNA gyrase (YacG/DUF329 family)
MTPVVKCPQCRNQGRWFEAEWGPFCSRRCKLIDLGKWFSEENVVSSPLTPEHLEDYEHLPPGPELDRPERDR